MPTNKTAGFDTDASLASSELVMWINNNADLYRHLSHVQHNMARKFEREEFNPTLAIKAFEYVTDAGAKHYSKEFGGEWSQNFPVVIRRLAAKMLLHEFLAEFDINPEHFRHQKRQRGAGTQSKKAEFDPKAPVGYKLNLTYTAITWTDPEAGHYEEDHGFVTEDDQYETLEELVKVLAYDRSWLEWSGSPPQPGDWVVSQSEKDFETGEDTTYAAHIEHTDGSPLTVDEQRYIHERLGLLGPWPRVATVQVKGTDLETAKQVKQELHAVIVNKPWFRGLGLVRFGDTFAIRLNADGAMENAGYQFPDEFLGVPVKVVFIDQYQKREAHKMEKWKGKHIKWGSEPWPSDDYLEYIKEEHNDVPPIDKDNFYTLYNKRNELYSELHKLKVSLNTVDKKRQTFQEMSARIRDKLRFDRFAEDDVKQERLSKLEQAGIELEKLNEEHAGIKQRLNIVDDDLIKVLHEYAPISKWIDKHDPRPHAYRYGSHLGSEYNVPVSAEELDPEVVHWFHIGIGDPIYALGSRLYSYGDTLASVAELEALKQAVEDSLHKETDVEEKVLIRMQDLLDTVNQKLKEM